MAYIGTPAGYTRTRPRTTTSQYNRYRPTTNTPLRGNSSRTRWRVRELKNRPMGRFPSTAAAVAARYLYTRYKSRKKKLTYKVPQGVGSTFSSCKTGRMMMSRVLYNYWKTNQKFKISEILKDRISTTTFGLQALDTTIGLNSTDFNDDVQRITGGTSTALKNTTSLIYEKVTDITTFTNTELTTTYLDIYEITPRYNTGETPIAVWTAGLLQEESPATVSIPEIPYEKPFRSKSFCLAFRVNKIIKLELAPGESHKHTSVYGINRMVHGQVANTDIYTTNFTNFRMYVASGVPINDSTNKELVSTSSVVIDVVIQRSWCVAADARPATKSLSFNTLSTVSAVNVVTDTSVKADGEA